MPVLTAEQVKELIPNRDPIFFVDSVEELEPGKKVIAKREIKADDPIFKGHFPGNPVYPGVLIIETLAQVGSIPLLSMDDFEGKTAFLGGLNKVKFRQVVKPGDVLTLQVDIIKLRKNAGIGHGQAFVDGKKVCECDMTFIIGAKS